MKDHGLVVGVGLVRWMDGFGVWWDHDGLGEDGLVLLVNG